jgi:AcrR family transcriptional regulator
MDVKVAIARRTQAERTAATRAALVAAARALFAEHGYADVGTEQIAEVAGVTRGALYHQFADKADLFAAVLEAVEVDLTARLIEAVGAAATDDPLDALVAGADAWLDASAEPEVRRIALLDGPAVLGWERWREVGLRHGLGLVTALLTELMDAGAIPVQPIAPLAHILTGALDEAAIYVASASDRASAREEAGAVLRQLVATVTIPPSPARPAGGGRRAPGPRRGAGGRRSTSGPAGGASPSPG